MPHIYILFVSPLIFLPVKKKMCVFDLHVCVRCRRLFDANPCWPYDWPFLCGVVTLNIKFDVCVECDERDESDESDEYDLA